ncbi:unnamed protein product [marine sediment metagenome]|uniref:Uncharacterized protein n=1 Tax=marine sediment metagenome TaxID=412755 RepID=X1RF42_9ZZZZ
MGGAFDKRQAALGSEPKRKGKLRLPEGSAALSLWVGSPGIKKETCGWLRLFKGVIPGEL